MNNFIFYHLPSRKYVPTTSANRACEEAYDAYVRVPRGDLDNFNYFEKLEAARKSVAELEEPDPKPQPLLWRTTHSRSSLVFPWGSEPCCFGGLFIGLSIQDPLSGRWECCYIERSNSGGFDVGVFHYIPATPPGMDQQPGPETECVNSAAPSSYSANIAEQLEAGLLMRSEWVRETIDARIEYYERSGHTMFFSCALTQVKHDLGL